MQVYIHGEIGKPVLLLIHGMGCNVEKSFGHFVRSHESRYRILCVDLDGHDGKETFFTTIRDQAEKLAQFLQEQSIQELYAIVGMSLGGFVAMDLVCRCGVKTECFVYDSGYVPPLPFRRPFSKLMAWGFGQILQGKNNIVTDIGMDLLMGYHFSKVELCESVSEESIYRVEYSCMAYQLPENLEILNTEYTWFLYGAKEKFIMKAMRILQKRLPDMQCRCIGNYGHGELMFTKPEEYSKILNEVLETERTI